MKNRIRTLSSSTELKIELGAFLKEFEPYYKRFFERRIKSVSSYPKIIPYFYKQLNDFSSGGKRMRAFLVYLGYKTAGGRDLIRILPISLALELLHSFLLIHDDIIDKSDFRRGKLTMHKRLEKLAGVHYGFSQAIIVGDIAYFEAIKLVNESDFDLELKQQGISTLDEVILETAYGELLDVDYSYHNTKLAQIKQVTDLKTSRYTFVGPLTIGAVLAGAEKKVLSKLTRFGLLVGMAFQLRDDILGVFADEKILGKPTLSDMREGKNTILIYKAREFANDAQLKELSSIWGNQYASARDLKLVQRILKESGAYDWCIAENLRLVSQAKSLVPSMAKNSHLTQLFEQLADYVISREK